MKIKSRINRTIHRVKARLRDRRGTGELEAPYAADQAAVRARLSPHGR